MKDNEFKARNKDTDFSKKVEADTVLGRQSAKGSAKPFTSSEHNRYQQKFLDTEKPLDTSTVQNPSPYNLEDWNQAFAGYSEYIQGNERSKFGIYNDNEGLLLIVALILEILSGR